MKKLALLFGLLLGLLPMAAWASSDAPVVAKYYAWYDENTWGNGTLTDQPAQPYRSSDRAAVERQVGQAQSAGIDGFELNWWGPDNPTDANLQMLLEVARAKGFKVTVDVDLNSPFIRSRDDAARALGYLKRYYGDPAWFRVDGRPVVSFYGIRKYSTGDWAAIRATSGNGDALWIGEGDQFGYLQVFDGMHPYSVAWSGNPSAQLASYANRTRAYPGKLWVATVMPGYNDTRLGRPNGFAVDRQGGNYYRNLWQGAIATQPAFVVITSWNEWPEGSYIEPSRGYGDLYLSITREMTGAFASRSVPPAPRALQPQPGDGRFFNETGGGRGGYAVTDRDGIGFWSAFQALGGVDALGFPTSQRYEQGGFLYQAMQGAVLQWRPELGRAVLANTFEWFTEAGRDDWLLESAGIPKPIRDDGSSGDWERAKQVRLSWLSDPAIKRQYLAAGSLERAIELYGLPQSMPERHGPFVTQRFQRIAFQHWVENVPGMPPVGSVVRVLAGDLLKQVGMIPAQAAAPSAG
ncbi:MAG TPA: endo-1,3-alpha-glucanase family glycosylhydrolase [Chloroflexota bacterium]|nr:endo-1,3-alpha-glucanase family glycosylhydrolase [Chloroflexota bacterium]